MENRFNEFYLFFADKWRQHFRDNWNKDDSWGQTESIQNTYNNNGKFFLNIVTPCPVTYPVTNDPLNKIR